MATTLDDILNQSSEELLRSTAELIQPTAQVMVDERITEFIRLGLPKWMLNRVRTVAGKQQVCRFIRDAIEQKLLQNQ